MRFDAATDLPLEKLRDAKQTLGEFSRAWDDYRARVQGEFEPVVSRPNVLSYVARLTPDIRDERMERLLRAAVSDIRSALDNLVHGIGIAAGADARALKQNQFPVVLTTKDWTKRAQSSLKQLPQQVVDRIHDVQPFSRPRSVAWPEHPLIVLSGLDNGNKHRDSFRVALVPNIAGKHRLGEATFDVPAAVVALLSQAQLSEQEVGDMLKFPAGGRPVHDGDVVLELLLPSEVELHTLGAGPLDLPLSLAAVYEQGASGHFPVLPVVRDAWKYVRDAVRYVSGLDPNLPSPSDLSR